jgi:hypothetical protein
MIGTLPDRKQVKPPNVLCIKESISNHANDIATNELPAAGIPRRGLRTRQPNSRVTGGPWAK